MSKREVTQDLLKELFDYCPDTGIFTRKVKTALSVKVGDVAGSPDAHGYLQISIWNFPYKAHRLAWLWAHGEWPKGHIDHINGDKADNRLANLRDVTASQNLMNSARSKANKSGHKGVWFDQGRGKWQAYITVNQKRINLGRFTDPERAALAYRQASAIYHGEYGRVT